MKKAIVLGLGKTGISACAFLHKEGYEVMATDDKQTVAPHGAKFAPSSDLVEKVKSFDFVLISPGVPPTHPLAQAALKAGVELFCDVELALRYLKDVPLFGITGSNGKTTTTSLTCHMLQCASINARTVGNIGVPVLDEIQTAKDPLVIELSSFQLETMKTPALQAACILNITPNHLDRHGSMDEYTRAKRRIALCLKPGGVLWVQRAVKWEKDQFTFGFEPDCDLYTDGLQLFRHHKKEATLPESLQHSKSHDVENFMAAFALAREYKVSPEVCVEAFYSFTKPKHRLQFVRTVDNVHYYDDSKATSVDAVIRAVESLKQPIVLIAGGVHKGHPYDAWCDVFKDKVRATVLIGQAAKNIENDLQGVCPIYNAQSLHDAIYEARKLTKPGDAVLLSPGCASYDMFSSYEERGDKFQEIVSKL